MTKPQYVLCTIDPFKRLYSSNPENYNDGRSFKQAIAELKSASYEDLEVRRREHLLEVARSTFMQRVQKAIQDMHDAIEHGETFFNQEIPFVLDIYETVQSVVESLLDMKDRELDEYMWITEKLPHAKLPGMDDVMDERASVYDFGKLQVMFNKLVSKEQLTGINHYLTFSYDLKDVQVPVMESELEEISMDRV